MTLIKTTPYSTTEKYKFADATVSPSTSLSLARYGMGGVSNSHAGLA